MDYTDELKETYLIKRLMYTINGIRMSEKRLLAVKSLIFRVEDY